MWWWTWWTWWSFLLSLTSGVSFAYSWYSWYSSVSWVSWLWTSTSEDRTHTSGSSTRTSSSSSSTTHSAATAPAPLVSWYSWWCTRASSPSSSASTDWCQAWAQRFVQRGITAITQVDASDDEATASHASSILFALLITCTVLLISTLAARRGYLTRPRALDTLFERLVALVSRRRPHQQQPQQPQQPLTLSSLATTRTTAPAPAHASHQQRRSPWSASTAAPTAAPRAPRTHQQKLAKLHHLRAFTMENTFIPKGMEIVKEAVVADNNDELERALSLYKQACNYFLTGIKYMQNETSKAAIKSKMVQYLDRAEEIQKLLASKSGKRKAIVAGNGNSTADAKDEKDGEVDPDTAKLQGALAGAIVKEKPNVKWDDVAGLEQAKGLLKEAVILPAKFPQLFTGNRTPWKGILMYGPPGTGKSFLAKAVATEAGSCFLAVSSSDLISKYQGESERLVKQLFELARKNTPAIIFIDEVDSLCSSRSEGENDSTRRVKTEFLVQMQGVGKDDTGVLVLGATNTPWELDPAIRRRFEKRVHIPLPDVVARHAMLKKNVGSTPNDLTEENYGELARRTEGFSGADVSILVRDALYQPVRIAQSATHFKKVRDPTGKHPFVYEPCSPGERGAVEMSLFDLPSDQLKPNDVSYPHFLQALDSVKPSVGSDDLRQFEDWTHQFGVEG